MLNTFPNAGPAQPDPLTALERQVAAVREAMFDVTDTARQVLAHEMTDLHVSLQAASNELGRVECLLHDATRPSGR